MTGSSLYSRETMIHMSMPVFRIRPGSTVWTRSVSSRSMTAARSFIERIFGFAMAMETVSSRVAATDILFIIYPLSRRHCAASRVGEQRWQMDYTFDMKPLTTALLLLIVSASSQANERLEGAWERVSLTNSRTGESPEAANRRGLLIFSAGHYSLITMNPERRYLSGEEVSKLSANREIEYLREWLDVNAHSGRYELNGRRLTWFRDLSENPREVGTTVLLGVEWRDELLVLQFSLPNGDAYDWVWRKIQ